MPDRDAAAMRPVTAALFAEVCARYACVVITGRSREDVLPRLEGARVLHVVGHHGLDLADDQEIMARAVASSRRALERALASVDGVEIEDKGLSLAVHYRRSRRRAEARAAIVDALSADANASVRTIGGKLVVNVVPARAPHKGDALVSLRAREGADAALFVGDDVTDEDVFALDAPFRLLTVRVGASPRSRAAYFVDGQRDIDALLGELVRVGGSCRGSRGR